MHACCNRHPFTASAVLNNSIYFYIKAMRRTGKSHFGKTHIPWTARLADLVANNTAVPAVRLSGPFGCTHFDEYENLVLFAGGIGITPMIAIFNNLLQKAREGCAPPTMRYVNLVWMARKLADFRFFEEFLQLSLQNETSEEQEKENQQNKFNFAHPTRSCESSTDPDPDETTAEPGTPGTPGTEAKIKNMKTKLSAARRIGLGINQVHGSVVGNVRFRLQLFCTGRDSISATSTGSVLEFINQCVTQGRCDVAEQLRVAGHGPQTIAATCGPDSLSLSVSEAAWKAGCDFHAEQFSF